MKRTKPSTNSSVIERLRLYETLTTRSALASALGFTYGGLRNVDNALGYKDNLTFQDFLRAYQRQDIAAAVIDRPIRTTWQGSIDLIESDNDKDTPLEQAWKDLEKRLHVKHMLSRLDTITGIGRYGVLFLGFNDAANSNAQGEAVKVSTSLKLLYIRAISEINATVTQWDTNTSSPRFGLPEKYTLTLISQDGKSSSSITAHHTRIIHVADKLLDGMVVGSSRLEPVFDRLTDLKKLVGGSAEMFWRGARPGYSGEIDKDVTFTEDDKAKLKEQIDEYDNNLRRFLVGSGVSISSLAPQVADPQSHVDVQIQMISAYTGIPKRILTGSEVGELASSQDRDNWFSLIKSRREEFAEPVIIQPFVDRLIAFGILPPPATEYNVQWTDLWSPSEKEKAEVGQLRATALATYANSPYASSILPVESFYKWCLSLDDDQIELIRETLEAEMLKEEERALTELENPEVPPQEGEVEEEEVNE